jgi:hypothetical protein
MVRRGRCRCGEILTFRKGPRGFKTRCPSCGAIVRLRLDDAPKPIRPPPLPRRKTAEPFIDVEIVRPDERRKQR